MNKTHRELIFTGPTVNRAPVSGRQKNTQKHTPVATSSGRKIVPGVKNIGSTINSIPRRNTKRPYKDIGPMIRQLELSCLSALKRVFACESCFFPCPGPQTPVAGGGKSRFCLGR